MEEERSAGERSMGRLPMLAAGAGVLAALLIGAFALSQTAGPGPADAPEPVAARDVEAPAPAGGQGGGAAQAPAVEEGAPAGEHEHDWQPVWGEKTVGTETETVEVPAVMGPETTDETVCNVCMEVVTGHVREHEQATGHIGATPGVPVTREVVVKPAETVEVVTNAGSVKLVVVGEQCAGCNATRVIGEGEEEAGR